MDIFSKESWRVVSDDACPESDLLQLALSNPSKRSAYDRTGRSTAGLGFFREIRVSKLRRRIKHTTSFAQRLIEEAAKFREAAERLPPGTERELLMKRVRQAEAAMQINDWLAAPQSAPPAALGHVLATKHR